MSSILSLENRKIAVLDLGTNTFNLIISEIGPFNKITQLYRDRIAVKIGQGGINQKNITPEAQQRAILAVQDFKETIDKFGIQEIRAIATSAFRNAHNGQELADRIYSYTGISIEIIDGEEEAELIYHGVKLALDIGSAPALVMDVGGGSVEFIIGTNKEIFWKQSFEIGAQRLLEMFHTVDPIPQESILALNNYLSEKLKDLLVAVQRYNPQVLIGSSGAFDTLVEIEFAKQNQPISLEEKAEFELYYDLFLEIYNELVSKNKEERKLIKGMIEMRVDMIVVASILIKFVKDQCAIGTIRVSTYSLKEGVLYRFLYPENVQIDKKLAL
ncbi:MAG: exopolyphosphatase [Cytophagales bacterium]|nr:exopolyphosphatase [Cytophagales bacterium]